MIIYFSGTGNSEFVAGQIAGCLGEQALDLFERIKTGDHSELHSVTPFVIVSPTYAWQLPHTVRDYLLKTPMKGSGKAYFVLTCGDDTGSAGHFAEKLCRKKGLEFMGLSGVRMPENYIAMFDAPPDGKARHIVAKAIPVCEGIAEKIARGERIEKKTGVADLLKSTVVNTVFCNFIVKDRQFTVSDDCVACGKCADVCPVNNVTAGNGKPVWNGKCIHCMACITSCPKKAIEYGKKSVGQPRYRCPEPEITE